MKQHYDAVVALGAHVEPTGELSAEGVLRTRAAVAELESGTTPYVIMTGSRPFRHADQGLPPVAEVMRDYAVQQLGAPTTSILTEIEAFDTVGDAVFTKRDITEPRSWRSLAVLSTESHVPRAIKIFAHVMGDAYKVSGLSAGAYQNEAKRQWLQERAGGALAKMLLNGTLPGDDEAIAARLRVLVPGYAEGISAPRRIGALFAALPRVVRPLA